MELLVELPELVEELLGLVNPKMTRQNDVTTSKLLEVLMSQPQNYQKCHGTEEHQYFEDLAAKSVDGTYTPEHVVTTSTSCAGKKKSKILGYSQRKLASEMQASNNQQDDGRTVGLSRALVDHSRCVMPIERANALGNSRLAVLKSGAQFSCRQGLRTLDKGIEGRNLRSSDFLSKFYTVRAADKTRTHRDITRRSWLEASLPFGLVTSQWRSVLMIMGGGRVPYVVFKQNFYFTYFMKLFWSRATREVTNHFRKDPVS